MNWRVRLSVLALLLVAGGVQVATPAGAASLAAAAPSAAPPAATAPLFQGNIEFRSAAGAISSWSGGTSATGATATFLAASMPSPSDATRAFRLTMVGSAGPITPGSYRPGLHALFNSSFTQGTTIVCSFSDGQGSIQVDQYVVDGGGAVTAYAVSFVCPQTTGTLGTWSGTLAYNVGPTTPGQGYYLYRQNGSLVPFGNDGYLGYLGDLGAHPLNQPVVGMAPTAEGAGYWMVASDGGVFAFGDAPFLGSMGGKPLNQPIVGMAATADGGGYWLVASDGGVFAFGAAPFLGSMGGTPLNRPVVGMAAAPGAGYWLVASDGGIFSFGAPFWGSTGAMSLNRPVVGMAPTTDGAGYWLVAADGGIFTFGDAGFHGSAGGLGLFATFAGMHPTTDGSGYWLATTDGIVGAFGVPDLGSLAPFGPADVAGITG